MDVSLSRKWSSNHPSCLCFAVTLKRMLFLASSGPRFRTAESEATMAMQLFCSAQLSYIWKCKAILASDEHRKPGKHWTKKCALCAGGESEFAGKKLPWLGEAWMAHNSSNPSFGISMTDRWICPFACWTACIRCMPIASHSYCSSVLGMSKIKHWLFFALAASSFLIGREFQRPRSITRDLSPDSHLIDCWSAVGRRMEHQWRTPIG